jgi:hypothetical protein
MSELDRAVVRRFKRPRRQASDRTDHLDVAGATRKGTVGRERKAHEPGAGRYLFAAPVGRGSRAFGYST